MRYHLEREAFNNLNTWYARVPTEANVSDYPSRAVPHPLLPEHKDQSFSAVEWFGKVGEFPGRWPSRIQWGKPAARPPRKQSVMHAVVYLACFVANLTRQTMKLILIIELS